MHGLLAGRYQIEEEIGRGGMATVYRGFDRSLERRVAVKVLHAEIAGDEQTVARFRAEAQAAARLSHANIAQVYDTGTEEDCHYMVMEYLPEPDLKSVIREYAPLPAHKVAEVAVGACEALGYAHQHGLIHRDVKPHNILFTSDGRPKLTDFGIAAAIGEQAGGKPLVGSAHYLSPEEVHGNAPTPQSDLYSLGVVMYEALTGRTPFQGETTEAVIAKRLAGPPPAPRALNPEIPAAAEHVVLKALATDPNQRYQTAGEMLADLRRLAAGAPVSVAGPPTADATQTMVLPSRPDPVSSVPVREAAPGPRRPTAAPPKRDAGLQWLWGVGGFIIGVAALVGLVFLLKYIFYPGTGRDAMAVVPGVTGRSREQARQTLEEIGLELGRVEEKETEDPPGTVIEQSPAMGERVAAGTQVDVVVAKAKDEEATVAVIAVVGLQLADAEANLRAVELLVGEVEQVYDDAPVDQVIAQTIPPGTKVEKGQGVDLKVSLGPQDEASEDTGDTPEPTGANGEPDEDHEQPEPTVQVMEDLTFDPGGPTERRFDVSVLVNGTRKGQEIEIVLIDDDNVRLSVHNRAHDPGSSVQERIKAKGTATFEIYRDGELIDEVVEPLMLPEPSVEDEPVETIE